jgi:integrase
MAKKIALNNQNARKAAPASGQIELWDKTVGGFGLRIAAGGARTYFILKRLNGTLVRRTVGKHPPLDVVTGDALQPGQYWAEDARARAIQMLADLARGIDPVPRAASAPVPAKAPQTFGEVAAAYLMDPSKRGGGALRSRGELERKVRVDLAVWKDRPAAAITRADVKAMINAKHKTSPVAANRLLALVRRIFRWAVREDLIGANPAMDIDPPAQEEERDRVLSLGELARIWAGAEALGYPFGPLIKMLILTAQRRSEVSGLRWEEIAGKAWKLPDSRAKRGKGHLVPLSPQALAILEELPRVGDKPSLAFTTGRRQTKPEPGQKAAAVPVSGWSRMKDRLDWIIACNAANAAGDRTLDRAQDEAEETTARVTKQEIMVKAKQEIMANFALPAWTLHDLRRSVATHLRDPDAMGDASVERLTVSKILNHAEGGMTRIYDRYSNDAEKRRALEAWALVIEGLCGLNDVSRDEARA